MTLDTFLDATFNTKLCLTLLHSVWQVLILAAIAAGLDRFSRRRSVERSYLLHTIALGAALLLLPVTYLLVDVPEPTTLASAVSPILPEPAAAVDVTTPSPVPAAVHVAEPPSGTGQIASAYPSAVPRNPSSTLPATLAGDDAPSTWSIIAAWIAGLYAAGVAVMLIRLWRGFWQADRLVATAGPLQDGPIAGLLQSLAREWSLRAVPALAVAERIVVPQVVGLLRPTILLPASALTGLSTDELRMILAHELAHIRRHDLWINLLQRLAETVLFFNPALWYLSRRISTLREFCCDEQICRSQTERGSDLRTRYATALLHVAELSQRPPREPQPTDLATLAAAGRSPSELRRRIAHLFGEPIREPLRLSRGCALALIAATALLLAGPAVWETKHDIASAQDGSSPADKTGRLLSQEKRFELLVRGPDGEPVPQAAVEVRTKPLPTAEQIVVGQYLRAGNYGAFVQADEQGRVVLEVPTPPERFNVSIVSDGYGPYWAGWSSHEHPQPIPARFVAELDAGWSVGGLVVDEQGEPIAGAEVYPSIQFKKRPGDADPLGIGRTMTTDASGAWRFDSVPASKNDVHVSIDHPDYMPSRLSLARNQFELQPDQKPNATIELKRGLSVTGHVTDADGQPIAGALVRTKFHNDIRQATTDDDGNYQLKGCEPRMARIVVSAKGKAVDMRDVRVDPELEPVDFQMQPGGTVRIHVVDEEGNGIPKARIFFQRWRGDRYEYFEFDHVNQYTDQNGVWEWNEAPLDEFKADICRPEGMQLTSQPLIAREAEYVFSPPRALVVSGHVIDARTKAPIKTFSVTPGLRNADPGIRMDWIPSQSYEATDGSYRVSFNRDEPAHLVRIEADGYLVAISRDIRGDEGEVDVDFALQPADDIAATILTAEGQPAAGAKIALGVAGSQISIKAGEIDDGQTYATQLTADEQGRFSIPTRTEAFQLVVTHPAGFAYLKSVDGPIPDKITLTAWARAEGAFRVGPKPAAGVTLSMFGDGIHSWGDDVPHIFTTHDVTTGPGGEYVFERVFPGRRSIGRRILLMVDEGATEVTSSLRVPAEFVAGETTTLNLGGSGRAVIGKLAPPDDYQGQVLWNFALVNATVVPERPPMVHPPAEVAGDPKKLKAWWQKWEATAEGRAWALHEAYDRQRWGSLYVTATVDREGSFRIDDLPAGKYDLSVRFDKQGAGVLTDYHFEVPPADQEQPSAPLDLGRLTLQAN